jgi:hypothetical protein
MTKDTHFTSTTDLDITQEKKDLRQEISDKEKFYKRISKELEHLKAEISTLQEVHDYKLGHLYARLDQLENLLFKYRHISEYTDDIFSFEEAQKVFESTMKERQERMDEEYRKQSSRDNVEDTEQGLSPKHKEELKRIYRNLAYIFHPDKTGGDEAMMKRINKAYSEGNLQELRSLDMAHIPRSSDDTLRGLQHRLVVVTQLIRKAKKEKLSLKKSHLFALRKDVLKSDSQSIEQLLDSIASELEEKIVRKEQEVGEYIKQFGIRKGD